MAYSRRQVEDHKTIMNKDLYDNLQDGIDEILERLNGFSFLNSAEVLAKRNVQPYICNTTDYNLLATAGGWLITDEGSKGYVLLNENPASENSEGYSSIEFLVVGQENDGIQEIYYDENYDYVAVWEDKAVELMKDSQYTLISPSILFYQKTFLDEKGVLQEVYIPAIDGKGRFILSGSVKELEFLGNNISVEHYQSKTIDGVLFHDLNSAVPYTSLKGTSLLVDEFERETLINNYPNVYTSITKDAYKINELCEDNEVLCLDNVTSYQHIMDYINTVSRNLTKELENIYLDSKYMFNEWNESSDSLSEIKAMASNGNCIVAVGGNAYFSTDGISWVKGVDEAGSEITNVLGVCYDEDNNLFWCISSDNKLSKCSPCEPWVQVDLSSLNLLYCSFEYINCANGKIVITPVQTDMGRILVADTSNIEYWYFDYLSDGDNSGTNEDGSTTIASFMGGFKKIVFGDDIWIGITRQGLSTCYSDDFNYFYNCKENIDLSNISDIVYGKDKFVLTDKSRVFYYVKETNEWLLAKDFGSGVNLKSIIYENGVFITSDYNGNAVYVSNDGITWESSEYPLPYPTDCLGYVAGNFIANSPSNSKMYYSKLKNLDISIETAINTIYDEIEDIYTRLEGVYTSSQVDNKLSGKANVSHTHGQSDITHYVHHADEIYGSAGYVKIATLKTTNGYLNAPIVIELSRRSAPTTCVLYIKFNPENNTDPALGTFVYTGTDYNCYIHKSAPSTFDLYVRKSENYDAIGVVRYHRPYYMRYVTVTWTNEGVTSVPTDAVVATLGGAVNSKLDTFMSKFGYAPWLDDAHRTLMNITETSWAFSTNPNNLPTEGYPTNFSTYATVFGFSTCNYKVICYLDVFGNFATYATNSKKWQPFLPQSALVNNLLATTAGSPLDATQGKILNDKITNISTITKGTLSAGSTSITLSDSRITTNSALSFYTSIYGVNPNSVSVSSGSVTLTFDAQASSMTVGVSVDG